MRTLQKLGITAGDLLQVGLLVLMLVAGWGNLKADVRSVAEKNQVQDTAIEDINVKVDEAAKSAQTNSELLYEIKGQLQQLLQQRRNN